MAVATTHPSANGKAENIVVLFTSNNARIFKNPYNFAELSKRPKAVVNPHFNLVEGVPPHYWKLENGVIQAMDPIEREKRDHDIKMFGIDNDTDRVEAPQALKIEEAERFLERIPRKDLSEREKIFYCLSDLDKELKQLREDTLAADVIASDHLVLTRDEIEKSIKELDQSFLELFDETKHEFNMKLVLLSGVFAILLSLCLVMK